MPMIQTNRTASRTSVTAITMPTNAAASNRPPSSADVSTRGSCMPSTTKMMPLRTNSSVFHTLADCMRWRAVDAVRFWGSSESSMPAMTTAMTPPRCSCSQAR